MKGLPEFKAPISRPDPSADFVAGRSGGSGHSALEIGAIGQNRHFHSGASIRPGIRCSHPKHSNYLLTIFKPSSNHLLIPSKRLELDMSGGWLGERFQNWLILKCRCYAMHLCEPQSWG